MMPGAWWDAVLIAYYSHSMLHLTSSEPEDDQYAWSIIEMKHIHITIAVQVRVLHKYRLPMLGPSGLGPQNLA